MPIYGNDFQHNNRKENMTTAETGSVLDFEKKRRIQNQAIQQNPNGDRVPGR